MCLILLLLISFRHTAFFLVAGNELKNQNQNQNNQVACKHAADKPAEE